MTAKYVSQCRCVSTVCGILVICLAPAVAAKGAELRTSSGQRRIYRQVSYTHQQAAPNESVDESSDPDMQEHPNAKSRAGVGSEIPRKAAPKSQSSNARPLAPAARMHTPPDSYVMPEMVENSSEFGDWLDPTCGMSAICGPCIGGNGWWADMEALIWWRRAHALPPLATTSSAGTAFANAGVLPAATVLFGGEGEGGEARPGGRVHVGTWFDACQRVGIGGRFFALSDETTRFNSDSTGTPTLAIPFFDEVLNRENALVVAFATAPDQRSGSIQIAGTSKVYGGDVYLRFMMFNDGCSRVDFIAGYQTSRIDEDLIISASSTLTGTVAPFRQDIVDIFATKNEFHGGAVGWMSEIEGGCWKLSSLVKVGLGNMSESVVIAGRNDIRTPPTSANPVTLNEGLFAQSTNIGQFSQSEFAVVPEINVNWMCHVTECWDVSVGYTFLYWSDVIQPGHIIDRRINEGAAEALPQFRFNSDDYWVHGVNLGAQLRF